MKKWEILLEEDVSPSDWFPIHRHKVRLTNGEIVDDYFITTLGPVGMVFPITTDNQVVLVYQYRHAMKDFFYELPAGMLQENKTLAESALEELEEETGIRTTLDNLLPLGMISNTPAKSRQVTHAFLAENLSFNSKQNLELTEEIKVILKSPKEVIEMVKSGEIWVADTVSIIMKVYLLYPNIFE